MSGTFLTWKAIQLKRRKDFFDAFCPGITRHNSSIEHEKTKKCLPLVGYQRLDTSCVPAYGNPCVCEDFDECAAKTHDCIQGKWPLYDFHITYMVLKNMWIIFYLVCANSDLVTTGKRFECSCEMYYSSSSTTEVLCDLLGRFHQSYRLWYSWFPYAEFRMRQFRVDDHRENALHFISECDFQK